MLPSRMENEVSKLQSAQQRAEDRNLCDWITATPPSDWRPAAIRMAG
jgi:hypothetical protein